MTPFIHIARKDAPLFNKWLRHARGLGGGNLPPMTVWAEPGVALDHKIARHFESPYGYPEVCTHMWHSAVTSIRGPVLYLEPDAWPCAPNWYEILVEEYRRQGEPGAMVSASVHPPHDMVGGIGIYDASKLPIGASYDEFRQKIRAGAAFDEWIGGLPETKRTPLIRHSYGIYVGGQLIGFHMFGSRERFDAMCSGAAIFHKDAFGSVAKWVGFDSPQAVLSHDGATPPDVSETSKHRAWFMPHVPEKDVIDIGYGGDPLVPWAVCCDMEHGSYTNVGTAPQHLGFDAGKLPFRDKTLSGVFNSHLIEDWDYSGQIALVGEWLRVLRPGGKLMILAPDQQRFLAHCARTGQSINANHKEADFSLANFKRRVLKVGNYHNKTRVVAEADFDDYSWGIILEKL